MHMLDTDISIYAMNDRSSVLTRRLESVPRALLAISTISVAELRFGASNSARPVLNHARVDTFIGPLEKIHFGEREADTYGKIKDGLVRTGQYIGDLDAMIAAVALAQDLTLVTNNVRHFSRVPGLRWENWLE